MNSTKMINSLFLALFFMLLSVFIKSASISDMSKSVKILSQNLMKMNIAANNNNKTDDKNEFNTVNDPNMELIKALEDKNEKQFEESQCEMETDAAICIKSGDRVILPFATQNNLVGYWNFDENKPLDYSGNKNHAVNHVATGPSFGGFGNSAYFSQGNYLKVPHVPVFESSDFSLTFWFYFIKNKNPEGNTSSTQECPLINKGDDDLAGNTYSRYPGIFFNKKEKYFRIFIKTDIEDHIQGESFKSNAKAIVEKWLHISLIKNDKNLLFYVNGILDAKFEIKGNPIINRNSLYIGGTPSFKDDCQYPFLLDELRYYNSAIEDDFIQAEASPVLGGIEPNFLQLGCFDCGFDDALKSCKEGYRVCSSIELHTGGYQICRAMGWLSPNTHVWTSSALKNQDKYKSAKGLAVCCKEIN